MASIHPVDSRRAHPDGHDAGGDDVDRRPDEVGHQLQ
jgi:hypothetical protein